MFPSPQGDGNERQERQASEDESVGWDAATWADLISSGVTAFFTALLWFVAKRQVDIADKTRRANKRSARAARSAAAAAKQSADVANRQLEQTALMERAWLAIDIVDRVGWKTLSDVFSLGEYIPQQHPSIEVGVIVRIRNGGRVAAQIIEVAKEFDPWSRSEAPPTPDLWGDYANDPLTNMLVIPGADVTEEIFCVLNADQLQALVSRESDLMLRMAVTYHNGIGTVPPATSHLCMITEPFYDQHNQQWGVKLVLLGAAPFNDYT